METSRVVSRGTGSRVGEIKVQSDSLVLGNERVIEAASKAVDIPHHTRWPVKDLKEIPQEFLSPATNLVNRTVTFEDLFDGAAVAEPKEFRAPKELPILTNGPTTASSFANKRVEVMLAVGAAPRAKTNRA